jgi:4-alpha-glucanotransferase
VAYQWTDFMVQSSQKLWQVLPLGPTGFADSPYACLSAFAGNPLLISLEQLVETGDLAPEDLIDAPDFSQDVDYGAVIAFKTPLLQKAAQNFLAHASADRQAAFTHFKNAAWLDDFCLFMALKDRFNQVIWHKWPTDIALRRPDAIAGWRRELADQIQIVRATQYLFFQQWRAVKAYANARGIQIVGDVPIFVAYDSADVWAHPDLFHLDERGRPTHVSGVPPDYFSETGQRWGNPLYRWDVMAERGYAWWIARLGAALDVVDVIRIDHFRGFVAYWEIPATEPTAVRGRWAPGPGAAIFEAIERALGRLPIMAEDLGVITPQVIELRERFGFPGMKILQFAFDQDALDASFGKTDRNPFLPHNYTPNFVVYTGTHDNDTAQGWFYNCTEEQRQKAVDYVGHDGQAFHWTLIRAAMASVAQIAIIPVQDILGLDSKARMNLPGTVGHNWKWRYPPDTLSSEIATQLAKMVKLYER